MMRTFLSVVFLFGVLAANAQEKPRVFITDSQSWSISGWSASHGEGSVSGSAAGFSGRSSSNSVSQMSGGARPQTAEIIKTFGEKCPDVVINNIPTRADYVVTLDHEGGKGLLRKDTKVAAFNRLGDAVTSGSTISVGRAVEQACKAISTDWAQKGSAVRAKADEVQTADEAKTKVLVSSNPSGADIEVNGAFVGNTPSTLDLPVGEHAITVRKSGFKLWERKIRTIGGQVNLSADLQSTPAE